MTKLYQGPKLIKAHDDQDKMVEKVRVSSASLEEQVEGVEKLSPDGNVKLNVKSQKLTAFFAKSSGESKKPLPPAKQRAIPIIKQAKPRVILSSQEEEYKGGEDDHEMKAQTGKKDLPSASTDAATLGTDDKNLSSPEI